MNLNDDIFPERCTVSITCGREMELVIWSGMMLISCQTKQTFM